MKIPDANPSTIGRHLLMGKSLLFMIACFISGGAFAQTTGEYLERSFQSDGDTLPYRVMYPNHFDESQTYPVVLFLHGRGESGTDNKKQLYHGSKLFQDSLDQYPAIVIFPQCPNDDFWAKLDKDAFKDGRRAFTFDHEAETGTSLQLVIDLIDSVKQEKYVDDSRLYVAGLSMGGMGTWDILWRQQDTYAAAISICGAGPRQLSAIYAETPVWIFHGVKDDVVPPRSSIGLTRGIQQHGGVAKLTLYPDANHISWDPAFADPRLLSWLFSHSK